MRQSSNQYDSKISRGFSLIELLISIAILAILFAMMMPSLLQSRTKANNTKTMHYLRAVAIKQADYYMDHQTYAGTETLLADLSIPSDLIVESWQGDVSDFCVQSKHSRGESYKVTAASQVLKGSCT